MVKWVICIILLLHGLIHLMGGVNELGLAKVQGLTGQTLLTIPSSLRPVMGIIWFLAVVLFLVAAAGLIANQQWWRTLATAAVIVSQVLILIWWPDAKAGTIANALIILATLFTRVSL